MGPINHSLTSKVIDPNDATKKMSVTDDRENQWLNGQMMKKMVGLDDNGEVISCMVYEVIKIEEKQTSFNSLNNVIHFTRWIFSLIIHFFFFFFFYEKELIILLLISFTKAILVCSVCAYHFSVEDINSVTSIVE